MPQLKGRQRRGALPAREADIGMLLRFPGRGDRLAEPAPLADPVAGSHWAAVHDDDPALPAVAERVAPATEAFDHLQLRLGVPVRPEEGLHRGSPWWTRVTWTVAASFPDEAKERNCERPRLARLDRHRTADAALFLNLTESMTERTTDATNSPPIGRPGLSFPDDQASAHPERLGGDGLRSGRIFADCEGEIARELELECVPVTRLREVQANDVDGEAILREYVPRREEVEQASAAKRGS